MGNTRPTGGRAAEADDLEFLSPWQPWRTHVRSATEKDLRDANQGRHQSRKFPRTEVAFSSLESIRSISPDLLLRLVFHPDERVPLRILTRYTLPLNSPDVPELNDLCAYALTLRALRDAESEGVIWTPLLDNLAGSPLWYMESSPPASFHADLDAGGDSLPTFRSPDEQARLLVPWMEAQSDPTAFHGIVRFQSVVLRSLLARHAGAPDDDFVNALSWPESFYLDLAANPNLKGEALYALRECIAEAFDDGRSVTSALEDGRPADHRWMHDGAAAHRFEDACRALAELHRSGKAPDGVARLLDVIGDWNGSEPESPHLREPRTVAYRALLTHSELGEDVLLDLLARVGETTGVTHLLISHPSAGPRLWRAVIESLPEIETLRDLAKHPEARKLPDVFEHLAKTEDMDVLTHLAFEATPRQVCEFLCHILPVSWQAGDRALEHAAIWPANLTPEDMAPFFAMTNPEHRMSTYCFIRFRHLGGPEGAKKVEEHTPQAIREMGPREPGLTVDLIEGQEWILPLLSPSDLAPLLSSTDQAARVRAITLLGDLRGNEGPRRALGFSHRQSS